MIEHGGNLAKLAELAGCEPGEILDFSVNLNPLGPPPGVFEPCFRSFDRLGEYPEPYAESLVAMLAERWRLPAARIVAGNGSNLLLNLLPPLTGAKRALIVTPGYLGYAEACRNGGLPVVEFRLREEEDFILDPARLGDAVEPGDLVILGNPDNPTGYALPRAELEPFVAAHPGALFLIDEAFIEFYGEAESLAGVMLPNLVVSRSFTKIYAVPGLRMGAMSGPEELMARLRARQGEWALSAPAVETAKFLLALPGGFPEETRRETERLRGELSSMLTGPDPAGPVSKLIRPARTICCSGRPAPICRNGCWRSTASRCGAAPPIRGSGRSSAALRCAPRRSVNGCWRPCGGRGRTCRRSGRRRPSCCREPARMPGKACLRRPSAGFCLKTVFLSLRSRRRIWRSTRM